MNDKSRLLKVMKTAISTEEIPRSLADIFSPLLGFEFFEIDADTGRVREFDETFGPLLKQRFFERVYDLAYDTCQLLRTFQQVRARMPRSTSWVPSGNGFIWQRRRPMCRTSAIGSDANCSNGVTWCCPMRPYQCSLATSKPPCGSACKSAQSPFICWAGTTE